MTHASNEHAIEQVRILAHSIGIECTPTVLADRSNLVLHLTPHPLVARVAMASSMVRAGMAWLRREVELSRFLDERGGAVTRPSEHVDPGPHEVSGLIISFWQHEQLLVRPPDPLVSGKRLAELHAILSDYPTAHLPTWGAWNEARVVFERAHTSPFLAHEERQRIQRAWHEAERIVESSKARSKSLQIVHGDAHLRNVIATTRGALWTDWEDAFVGPVEWDIACVRSRLELFGEERDAIEALCAAYDTELDCELVQDLGLVRNVQVILWLALFAERDESLLPRLQSRIAKLA